MIGALLTSGSRRSATTSSAAAVGSLAGDRLDRTALVARRSRCCARGAARRCTSLLNLVLTVIRAERQRRRHAPARRLLSGAASTRSSTRRARHPAPVAYCLPGGFGSITVLSAGLSTCSTPDELRAVIAHERAHVEQRHDIVLVAFRAWHAALPLFPIAHRAERRSRVLVEMLADDRARARSPTPPWCGPSRSSRARRANLTSARHDETRSRSRSTCRQQISRQRRNASRASPAQTPLPTSARAFAIGCAVTLVVAPTALLIAPAFG